MAFKKGDLVRLKSGGPLMVVSGIATCGIQCQWFREDEDGNLGMLDTGLFQAECLILEPKKEKF